MGFAQFVGLAQVVRPSYSITSMAHSLIAHSPGLARTIIMVPTGHFMHNPPWMAGFSLARTIFHGPKPVKAIEVLLYIFKSEIDLH